MVMVRLRGKGTGESGATRRRMEDMTSTKSTTSMKEENITERNLKSSMMTREDQWTSAGRRDPILLVAPEKRLPIGLQGTQS